MAPGLVAPSHHVDALPRRESTSPKSSPIADFRLARKLSRRRPVSVAMCLFPRLLVLACACAAAQLPAAESAAKTSDELTGALALVNARRYPEACTALERIIARDPTNAEACHRLGLVLKLRNDNAAWEEALKWLAKAVALAPGNAIYLGDFGGTSLQFASRTNSLSAATRGREAMEKALAIDPDYLDAREGLFHYYQRAPWPLGNGAKAAKELEEIRKRDPDLATVLSVTGRVNAKDYTAAFQLCDEVLARGPDNYTALYQYGRTASTSGQNLERGLASLQKCLGLTPPSPASPTHSNVWHRIGTIHEQLDDFGQARAAYEQALKLDPANRQAADALTRLR
jgi:tetratricopeptide (TPR) repeat protein